MATDRVEPFHLALRHLREGLRDGRLVSGERVAAVEIADLLRLSPTPVREAMSRLAGEGLLEDRRGQGFFVRVFTAADIGDLYRLSLAQLVIAHAPHRASLRRLHVGVDPVADSESGDPVGDVEKLFAGWVGETGSRVLISAHRIVQLQLGAVRRAEPLVLPGLAAEAAALRGLELLDSGNTWSLAVRRFHNRRIAAAERLAAMLQQRD